MAYVQYIVQYSLEKVGLIVGDPLFFLLVILVTYLYKREIKNIDKTVDSKTYICNALGNTCIGILIGLWISGTLDYMGIAIYLSYQALVLVPIAIVLMAIHPKLGCFSYVVPTAFVIEGLLKFVGIHSYHLEYDMLIMIIGSLHVVEGVLVILMGDKKSIKALRYKEGKIVVMRILRQMWIVPLFLSIDKTILPLYTVLAYGDMAQDTKKQKYITGTLILVYGILMSFFGLATMGGHIPLGAAIILMPVCHEFIFILSHW